MSENIIYKIVDKKTTEELPPFDDTYYEPDTNVSLIKQQIKEYLLKKLFLVFSGSFSSCASFGVSVSSAFTTTAERSVGI